MASGRRGGDHGGGAGVAGMVLLLNAPGAQWDTVGVLAAALGAASMACGSYLAGRWQVASCRCWR